MASSLKSVTATSFRFRPVILMTDIHKAQVMRARGDDEPFEFPPMLRTPMQTQKPTTTRNPMCGPVPFPEMSCEGEPSSPSPWETEDPMILKEIEKKSSSAFIPMLVGARDPLLTTSSIEALLLGVSHNVSLSESTPRTTRSEQTLSRSVKTDSVKTSTRHSVPSTTTSPTKKASSTTGASSTTSGGVTYKLVPTYTIKWPSHRSTTKSDHSETQSKSYVAEVDFGSRAYRRRRRYSYTLAPFPRGFRMANQWDFRDKQISGSATTKTNGKQTATTKAVPNKTTTNRCANMFCSVVP